MSLDELLDNMDAAEDVDENRLLPAMNKLWPYLVICLENKISVVRFLTSDCFALCNSLFCWKIKSSTNLSLCSRCEGGRVERILRWLQQRGRRQAATATKEEERTHAAREGTSGERQR